MGKIRAETTDRYKDTFLSGVVAAINTLRRHGLNTSAAVLEHDLYNPGTRTDRLELDGAVKEKNEPTVRQNKRRSK